MKWQNLGRSNNVDDRRGGGARKAVGGGITGIIIIVLALVFGGGDKTQLVGQLFNEVTQINTSSSPAQPLTEKQIEEQKMVSAILNSNEQVWSTILTNNEIEYRNPKLVLFSGKTDSGCGLADAGTGPFYCPSDETIYIDLTFFEELKTRFGASGGDFATAYVIAHEMGHHIQNLLGTSGKVHSLRNQLSKKEYNTYSVALELQADCYAGIWANTAEKNTPFLESGDIEEALSAASAVGDDHIQKQAQGYVVPDAFTHGTSEQRVYWFKKGFQTGDINTADTFSEIVK